jgi:hypothetical protein
MFGYTDSHEEGTKFREGRLRKPQLLNMQIILTLNKNIIYDNGSASRNFLPLHFISKTDIYFLNNSFTNIKEEYHG